MIHSLVCIDASLGLKLILRESDSALAQSLWEEWKTQDTTLIAPVLWGYEVISVIRNKVYRGQLPAEIEVETIDAIHQLPVQMLQPAGLHQRAWELARQFNRPAAYDSHYLALSEMADCPFWTADERLFNVTHRELNWVHWLGNYRPNIAVDGGES